MNKISIAVFMLFFCLFSIQYARADEKGKENKKEYETTEQKVSYALGLWSYNNFKKYFDLDLSFFIKGLQDGNAGQPKMTKAEISKAMQLLSGLAMKKQKEKMDTNKEEGRKFLSENGKKDGVVTLKSGLQYKVLEKGEGRKPDLASTVECHYKGLFMDGTEFDSSYKRGKPATFKVKGVIKGWSEALQLMRPGSKWILYIPSDLGYGDRGVKGNIEPGSLLIFEVELLRIVE